MQISSIKPVTIKTYNNINKYQANIPIFKLGTAADIFVKKKLPFDKLKNFNIAEYRQLSKAEINSINKMIYESFWLLYDEQKFFDYLNYHNIAAASIKNKLESKYGVGNFVFIPIGRSLSSIGKCLGFKIGENNVKQLPMSGAYRFKNMESNSRENFDIFNEYLSSIGLSKDKVQTSGKKYIFTDYCHTGASLYGAERLFKSEKVYGNLDNLEFINVKHLLSDIQSDIIQKKIDDCFYNLEFKPYSLVQKCYSLLDTKNAVIKPEEYTREAKYFYFKLLDNELAC